MDLAIYDLKLHKGRFIATIIGVGLLFTIVLAINGIYRGFLRRPFLHQDHQPRPLGGGALPGRPFQ